MLCVYELIKWTRRIVYMIVESKSKHYGTLIECLWNNYEFMIIKFGIEEAMHGLLKFWDMEIQTIMGNPLQQMSFAAYFSVVIRK